MSSMYLAAFQLGVIYALLPGPILIGSSQRVVTSGWSQGLWFILGATFADLIYIALVQLGISSLLTDNLLISLVLGVVGGGWLIKLGTDAIRVPVKHRSVSNAILKSADFKQALTDGLIINLFNPFAIVGWLSLVASFAVLWSPNGAMHEVDSLLILLMFLSGKKVWQLLVVGIISKARQQMHWRWVKSLSLVGGLCLIICGIGSWLSAAHLIF